MNWIFANTNIINIIRLKMDRPLLAIISAYTDIDSRFKYKLISKKFCKLVFSYHYITALSHSDVENVIISAIIYNRAELLGYGLRNPYFDWWQDVHIINNGLSIAFVSNFAEIVKLVILDKRFINKDGKLPNFNTILSFASRNGHLEIVKICLTLLNIDPAINKNEAIKLASIGGHLEIAKLLLVDPQVNPTEEGTSKYRDSYGIIRDILVKIAEPKIKPELRNNLKEILKILLVDERIDLENLAVGYSIKYDAEIILRNLFKIKNLDIIYLLLEYYPYPKRYHLIDLYSEFFDVILDNDNLELANLLLNNGDFTPSCQALRKSMEKGYFDITDQILEHSRCDIMKKPERRHLSYYIIDISNAHRAVEFGLIKIVRLALTITTFDRDDMMSFFRCACRYGQLEMVKLLLSDSRIDLLDDNNKTMCDKIWQCLLSASENGHTKIVGLLLSYPCMRGHL